MEICVGGGVNAEIANAGEFFATAICPIERTPEFVRLTFYSIRQTVSIVLTLQAFDAVARQIIDGPGLTAH